MCPKFIFTHIKIRPYKGKEVVRGEVVSMFFGP